MSSQAEAPAAERDVYRWQGRRRAQADKPAILAKTRENLGKIAQWQEKLYADGREGVVFVLRAMDAAGKDSTISTP